MKAAMMKTYRWNNINKSMRMVFGGFIFKDSIKREGEAIKLFSFEQIVTKVQKE